MIDPAEFGELRSEVRQLSDDMREMRADVRRLVALENQSIGAAWMGRGVAGIVGAAVVFIAQWVMKK